VAPLEADLAVTPIPVSPRVRAVVIIAVLLALVWLLRSAPTVPQLLITGGVLALVLSFPVRLLSKRLPRALAILLVVLGLLLLLVVALVVLIPVVVLQLTDLIQRLPAYADDAETLLERTLAGLERRGWLGVAPETVTDRLQQEAVARGQAAAEWLLGATLDTVSGTVGTVIAFFGTLFVAVYLLADFGRFRRLTEGLVAPRYADDVADLWRALDASLSRYLGGLLISITLQGTAIWIILSLLDVPYAVLLGLLTAATAVLPYVGAFLGAIPAVITAVFVSPLTALLTALAFLAVNQIEGNVLTPRIQGEAVRVHPLFIFLAVIAGGEIAGLLGAALAVPALAIARVLLDFFGERLYVRRAETVGVVEPPQPLPPARPPGPRLG
jgi:predicted PurR-regulated permease PerM